MCRSSRLLNVYDVYDGTFLIMRYGPNIPLRVVLTIERAAL